MARNVQLDALGALANGGFLRIYSGAQPFSADTPLSGQVLLAELRLGKLAFRRAEVGSISAYAISDDQDARASGIASWYRVMMSDGKTVLWDGSAGIKAEDPRQNPDLVLNSVNFQQHAKVSVKEFVHSMPQ